jgi:hypothetical protein
MVGALHSRVVSGTDADIGALAEAGWSEKEIMVVLDDKAPKHRGDVHCSRTKTALATSLMLSQRDTNENGTRMRQT